MPTPPEPVPVGSVPSGATRRHARPDAVPSDLETAALVPLAELAGLAPDARRAVRGVLVAPADALDALLPELDHLDVVAVDFPAFTDGRGGSHARHLRGTHGWRGELRAVGDVRMDLARSLLRCGFDVLEFAADVDPALLARGLRRYPGTYQPSYAVTGATAAASSPASRAPPAAAVPAPAARDA